MLLSSLQAWEALLFPSHGLSLGSVSRACPPFSANTSDRGTGGYEAQFIGIYLLYSWQPPEESLFSSGTLCAVLGFNIAVSHRDLYKAEEKQKRKVK